MQNPFGNDGMAAGYAKFRPPVHRKVIELARRQLPSLGKFRRALDIGCGAGLSTAAIDGLADHTIGIEPAEVMLAWSGALAPDADFLAGSAEQIPLRVNSVDVITAAGSINYANLDLFFPEARRVLSPGGVLLVYDFQPGRKFRGSNSLEEWFATFTSRYPWPPNEAKTITRKSLLNSTPVFGCTAMSTSISRSLCRRSSTLST